MEEAQQNDGKAAKGGAKPHTGFGTNMPLMSSAFDTAMWLNAA